MNSYIPLFVLKRTSQHNIGSSVIILARAESASILRPARICCQLLTTVSVAPIIGICRHSLQQQLRQQPLALSLLVAEHRFVLETEPFGLSQLLTARSSLRRIRASFPTSPRLARRFSEKLPERQ